MSYALRYQIGQDGVLFTLVKKALLGSPKPIPSDAWDLNSLGRSASAAGILLRALDEVEATDRLSNGEPIGEPAATRSAEGVLLSHARCAALSESAAQRLGLPPVTPLALSLRSDGIISDSEFQLEMKWLEPSGAVARGAQRTGAFVRYEGRWQRLPRSLYSLACAVDDFRQADTRDEDERKRRLALITKALPEEARVDASHDGYLRNLRVHHAAAFSLRLLTDNGEFQVEPVLFGRRVASDWDAPWDGGGSTEGGHLPSESEALLPPAQQDRFARELFDRYLNVRSTYVLGDSHYIHLEPLAREALQVVKEVRRADPETRKEFSRRPQAFLKERLGERFEDERIEDLFVATQEYSERISGLGVWQPVVLPWIKKEPNSWRPESFGLQIGSSYVAFTTAAEVERILGEVQQAMAEGRSTVVIQGAEAPATDATVNALQELKAFLPVEPDCKGEDRQPKNVEPENAGPLFIEVAENFEETAFSSYRGAPRAKQELSFATPHCLATALKPHQTEALEWLGGLWRDGYGGGLLADDMGLGKTLSTLAFLAWLREARATLGQESLPILVVAPTSLMGNWKDEVERHLVEPRLGALEEIHGPHVRHWRQRPGSDVKLGASCLDVERMRRADWILTTYETLRDYHHSFAAAPFAAAVFDEMQKAKNPASQISRAVKTVNAHFRLGLTGTPIENALTDVWAIMDVLLPGYLGDLKTFAGTYDQNDRERLKALKDRLEGAAPNSIRAMLRRMKSDALRGLPKKIEHVKEADMPPRQAEAYSRAVQTGMERGAGRALKYLHALRMISLHPEHPSLWREEGDAYIGWSARLERVMHVLDEVKRRREKALVFLDSLELQDVLADKLRERYRLPRLPFIINGSVQGAKRQEYVRQFQAEEGAFDVMILSPKAGGVGLTLTAASHVIHFSRWWNPAVEDQCTDRIYRIGQRKDANVYYPLALHPHASLRDYSFDKVLHALLDRKRAMSRDVLAPVEDGREAELLAKALTPEAAP